MNESDFVIMKYFESHHLPAHLQHIVWDFQMIARNIISRGGQVQEIEVALRKLLEAKDAAVRAYL